MGRVSYKAVKKYEAKTYRTTEVLLSIDDHAFIKQYCRQHGLTMSGYIYELIIKDMATKGIRLQGTATRNVGDIINSGEGDDDNNTSIQDSDVDVQWYLTFCLVLVNCMWDETCVMIDITFNARRWDVLVNGNSIDYMGYVCPI